MTGQPLVSIVTPSFNQGQFIERTIRSVLNQDYPALEYIVMDGGSTDGTLGILKRYEDRLTWLSEPDAGQSDAIRRGFGRARGEILGWLNSDDVYLPEAVSQGVRAFAGDPNVGFVYGLAEFIDRSGLVVGRPVTESWNYARLVGKLNYVAQPATFFTRDAYEAVGGLDPDLHFCMDYDLWIKLGSRYSARHIPELWAQMRMYEETKTASGGLPRVLEIERMIRRHGRSRLPVWYHYDLVKGSWLAGLSAGRDGRWGMALAYWRRALPYVASPYFLTESSRAARRRIHELGDRFSASRRR